MGKDDDLSMSPFERVGNKYYYVGWIKVSVINFLLINCVSYKLILYMQATWFQALLNCRSLGGYLASIENAAEMKQISDYLSSKYRDGIRWWIDVSDIDSEGCFYSYRTGLPIKYRNWGAGEPNNLNNEDCVQIHRRSKSLYEWNDLPCCQKESYLCEADNPKSIAITVS